MANNKSLFSQLKKGSEQKFQTYRLLSTPAIQARVDDLAENYDQCTITKGEHSFYLFVKSRIDAGEKSGQLGFGSYKNEVTGEKFPLTVRFFKSQAKGKEDDTYLVVNEPQSPSKSKPGKFFATFYLSNALRATILDTIFTGDIRSADHDPQADDHDDLPDGYEAPEQSQKS